MGGVPSDFPFPFPTEPAKDAYLVQQANIFVTQLAVRIAILQYRAELARLHDEQVARGDTVLSAFRTSAADLDREKDAIISALISVLERIPLNIVAVNTQWIVSKVRFIASTLLDTVDAPQNEADQTRVQHQLCKYCVSSRTLTRRGAAANLERVRGAVLFRTADGSLTRYMKSNARYIVELLFICMASISTIAM